MIVKPNSVKGHLTPREAILLVINNTALKIEKQEPNKINILKNNLSSLKFLLEVV